jgi:hypothetical protein
MRCPHCGYYTGAAQSKEWHSVTGKRTKAGWTRIALIAASLSVVFIGYAMRETGSAVTINGLRYRAYSSVSAGIDSLIAGDYAVASDHLSLAIREEPAFPEAHLALALSKLGLSEPQKAIEHALLAARFAELGLLDRLGALKLGDGTKDGVVLLSKQIQCVASEISQPLSVLDARWLLSVFGDLTRHSNCRVGVEALTHSPGRSPSQILQRALAACPTVFLCPGS